MRSRSSHSHAAARPATPRARGDFSGLWIPLVTPFRHGAVDHAALKALVQRLRGTGIAGFVACGSTAEAGGLERARRLWQAIVPWVEMCFAEPNPAPIKALLAAKHWMADELRAPMTSASPALVQRQKKRIRSRHRQRARQAMGAPAFNRP